MQGVTMDGVTMDGGKDEGGDVPTIGPGNGMVGYPTFDASGVIVKTIFNKDLVFQGKVNLESSIIPATGGPWTILTLSHDLSCLFPKGDWFSTFTAYNAAFGLQTGTR